MLKHKMELISKGLENRVSDFTSTSNLRSEEPFSKGETRTRNRIRCVKLVPLDASGYGQLAEVPAIEDGLICRPSGQNGLVCVRRDTFPINETIGWILQGGVLSSSALICIGVLLLFTHPVDLSSLVQTFPHTLGGVWDGIQTHQPQALICLGMLLLIATPVIRVAASILAFAMEQDRRYVVITTVVLAILLVSFLLGKGAG